MKEAVDLMFGIFCLTGMFLCTLGLVFVTGMGVYEAVRDLRGRK